MAKERILATLPMNQVEDWLEANSEEFMENSYFDTALISDNEDGTPCSEFLVDNLLYRIPVLDITIREGFCAMWDEETQGYEADWSLSLIYNNDGTDATAFEYFEQSLPFSALNNYLRFHEKTVPGNATVEIVLLEDEF